MPALEARARSLMDELEAVDNSRDAFALTPDAHKLKWELKRSAQRLLKLSRNGGAYAPVFRRVAREYGALADAVQSAVDDMWLRSKRR